MRIRTRYKLFKLIIAASLLVFVVSLFDMFRNTSDWKTWVLVAYVSLAVLALLLYFGYKPKLDEQEEAEAEPVPEPVEPAPPPVVAEPVQEPETDYDVVEVPRPRTTVGGLSLEGPQQFKCPFCAHVFGLEATHMARESDFRLHCPFCGQRVRVPKRPNVTRAPLADLASAAPHERGLFACGHCGEVVRVTAPHSKLDRMLSVEACPHCRGNEMVPATAA